MWNFHVSAAESRHAALRYMIKMVLVDIHKDVRTAMHLEVPPSYHEAKLGHVHGRGDAQ